MPEEKRVLVNCLGPCGKQFMSRDKVTNRVCPQCSRKLKEAYVPSTARFGTHHDGNPVNPMSED